MENSKEVKQMKLEQMTLFDLLEEYDHGWKKIPDDASVLIHGINVINVIDSGIKKEGNIEFAARGFVNDKQCWIGCVRGSNGESIAIMYAKDLSEGEQNDIRTKVESAADNQKEV